MFGGKLQKFLSDSGWHHQSAVLDTLSPPQQVSGLQGVEHITPLLLFLIAVVVCTTSGKGVQLLIIIIGYFAAAGTFENLFAGANRPQAAALVNTALSGWIIRGILFGIIHRFLSFVLIKQAVDEPYNGPTHHQYRQQ